MGSPVKIGMPDESEGTCTGMVSPQCQAEPWLSSRSLRCSEAPGPDSHQKERDAMRDTRTSLLWTERAW